MNGTTKAVYDENGYKILCGRIYKVYRSEYAGHVFYKIGVTKYDTREDASPGSKILAYKSISFRNKELNCDIPDGTMIRPKKLFEDFYFKANDKYNPVWTVAITDWEVVRSEEEMKNEAINEYNKFKNDDEIILGMDDLPF